ncbi:hypothetical protein BT69DRAFT_1306291 [Atractiella rhizophila]|nr:hypothetical protein BT69DRAFT_1306291 [Atractiella rhizophila]
MAVPDDSEDEEWERKKQKAESHRSYGSQGPKISTRRSIYLRTSQFQRKKLTTSSGKWSSGLFGEIMHGLLLKKSRTDVQDHRDDWALLIKTGIESEGSFKQHRGRGNITEDSCSVNLTSLPFLSTQLKVQHKTLWDPDDNHLAQEAIAATGVGPLSDEIDVYMFDKQLGVLDQDYEEATEKPKGKGKDKDNSEKKSLENVALACWSEAESEATHISANEESNWDTEQPQPLLVQRTGIIKWLKWSVWDKILKISKAIRQTHGRWKAFLKAIHHFYDLHWRAFYKYYPTEEEWKSPAHEIIASFNLDMDNEDEDEDDDFPAKKRPSTSPQSTAPIVPDLENEINQFNRTAQLGNKQSALKWWKECTLAETLTSKAWMLYRVGIPDE